jgi:DNA-directed RNA polymerase I, II, and III subunit RPABC1
MDGETGEWNRDALMCFFKIHRTVTKMLYDRGYDVDDEDMELDLPAFVSTYVTGNPEELNRIYTHKESNVLVKGKYDGPKNKIKKAEIEALLAELQKDQVKHCIFIINDGTLTKVFRTSLDKKPLGIRFEIFERKEVMINITEHELVPKHAPLNPDEKRELLDRYKVKDSQLPRILRTDPSSDIWASMSERSWRLRGNRKQPEGTSLTASCADRLKSGDFIVFGKSSS